VQVRQQAARTSTLERQLKKARQGGVIKRKGKGLKLTHQQLVRRLVLHINKM
jgi:hypothetical protein